MNIKKGIVMKTEKNVVYIMTNLGEFLKLKIGTNSAAPVIGEEYSGVVVENKFINITPLKYALTACLMFLMLTFGGGVYAYYKPVSTITISIDPSIELTSNKWGRVIYSKALNDNGKRILQKLHLENERTDNAITLFIDQAKKDNFINDSYIENNKLVTINITGSETNISSFKNKLKKYNLNIEIIDNGVTIFNQNAELEKKDLSKAYINTNAQNHNDSNINNSQYKIPNITDALNIKAADTEITTFNQNTEIKNNLSPEAYININTESSNNSNINNGNHKIPSIIDIIPSITDINSSTSNANNSNSSASSSSNSNSNSNGNANGNDNANSDSSASSSSNTNSNSNANSNGNSNGNGNANSNSSASSSSNTNSNSNANSNGNSNGNGNANSNSSASSNGNANGNSNVNRNSSANGNSNSNGKSNANDNGNANSNSNKKETK